MAFETYTIHPMLIKVLKEKGYDTPTPIQDKTLTSTLGGRDLLACAPTGSGKTAAFSLPVLTRLADQSNDHIQGLVLVPTRELALQVAEHLQTYATYLTMDIGVVYGGVTPKRHIKVLKRKPKLLVATPGRLVDLIEKGAADLRYVEALVLDEADKLLDINNKETMDKIIKVLPIKKQTIMVTATLPKRLVKVAQDLLIDPLEVINKASVEVPKDIDQVLYWVEEEDKIQWILAYLQTRTFHGLMIFTRTKKIADKLCKKINENHIRCKAIHGDKHQTQRLEAIDLFKSKKISVLIATDVAARGLDIDSVSHVINMNVPSVYETYIHRIGRTGRQGRAGQALTLCSSKEGVHLKGIEQLQGKKMRLGPGRDHEEI